MKHRHRQAAIQTIFVTILLLAGIPAWSQGSLNDWVDACDVTDSDLLQLLENEALLVDVNSVTPNVGDGTYNLANQSYISGWPPYYEGDRPLCWYSQFYNQPQAASGLTGDPFLFRSAVRVGPDLVLTAWHGPAQETPAVYAIFGLQYHDVGGTCTLPDFAHIPAANVFSVTEVVADSFAADIDGDFLLLRLDREVSASYPRVRRSGQGQGTWQSGDSVTLISHPEKLAAKVDVAGRLYGYSGTWPVAGNLHVLVFSSGGMIYNRTQRFLETVVHGGGGTTDLLWDDDNQCWYLVHEDWIGSFNNSLKYFAEHIPAFELLVTPLDTVVHEGCAGGPFTNPTTTRTVRAPATAPGSIDYEIQLPGTTQPQILTSVNGDLQGTLEPTGDGLVVTETIDANTAPCGNYDWTYTVTDATNGFTDTIRHKFVIHGADPGCVACSP
jgi:hypothetical protein